jgi:hypothetical protein
VVLEVVSCVRKVNLTITEPAMLEPLFLPLSEWQRHARGET